MQAIIGTNDYGKPDHCVMGFLAQFEAGPSCSPAWVHNVHTTTDSTNSTTYSARSN